MLGAKNLSIGVGTDNTTVIAWRVPGPDRSYIKAAVRPRGGSFSPASQLTPDSDGLSVSEPDVSVLADGTATVVWSQTNSGTGETVVQAATRPAEWLFRQPRRSLPPFD